MKQILLTLTALLTLLPIQIGTNNTNPTETKTEYVYICTGNYSKCYHKTENCKGLLNCSKDIRKITLQDAINQYHRRECKYCYGHTNETANNNTEH